ncbi:Trimethylguanosine synthase [Phlyctochytrium planicorne]|nr:Trimethylguanosine synthase [Phlyctochytrium planicorne]
MVRNSGARRRHQQKKNKKASKVEGIGQFLQLATNSSNSSTSDAFQIHITKKLPASSPAPDDSNDNDQHETMNEVYAELHDKHIAEDPAKTVVNWTQKSMPKELHKYWNQRFSLFSKFDEGIKMDMEGWYSVTPEKIAEHIASRMPCGIIVDAFCGMGGNAIQFAKYCKKVIAVDIDPIKLQCAKHNASIYGVEDKIEFVEGDFFELAESLEADVVFLSPPWGGPEYLKEDVFDLRTMMPFDGVELLKVSFTVAENVAYYLPRNIDPQQIEDLLDEDDTCELEDVYLNGRKKVVMAYFGRIFAPS